MRAAVRLAAQIQGQIEREPGARQWVVAHSHGGNIALHAVRLLRQSRAEAPGISVVTLATPFIHARRRTLSGWPVFVQVMFSVMVAAWAVARLAAGPRWNDWSFYISALVVGEVLLSIVGAGMHWGFLKRGNLFGWLGRTLAASYGGAFEIIGAVVRCDFIRTGYRTRILAAVHSPSVESQDAGEVIVLRAAGDEASLGLAAGQFLGWISALLNQPLTNLWVWGVVILATQVSILVVGVILHAGIALVIGFDLFLIPGLAVAAAVSVMLAAAVPFGWDGPFLSIFAAFSAEATPPGQTTVVQLERSTDTESKGLTHSRLYRSEPGISTIVKIICGVSSAEGTEPRRPADG